ncbi:MAG: E3 binding domain-containing protein [Oscillochloridaceae bacterium umkhey_bin13]
MSKPNAAQPRLHITPLARRIALEHGLDLRTLVGSGPHGRIGAADVRAHLRTPPAPPVVISPGPDTPEPAPQILPPEPSPMFMIPGYDPLATAMVEVELAVHDRATSPMILVANLVANAAALLPAHPWLNAAWDVDGIVVRRRIHIAVGLPASDPAAPPTRLVWQLIPDAGDLLPKGVQRALLTPRPTSAEPTFSVACLPVGATWQLAQPPLFGTAAALSLGLPNWRPVVRNTSIVMGLVATLTLCYDARVLDHRQAAAFLGAMRDCTGG